MLEDRREATMNHFLVSVLGFVNGAIAVAIILIFYLIGQSQSQTVAAAPVLGLLAGLVVAAMVCGLVAIAISIEKSLKHIATEAHNFYRIEKDSEEERHQAATRAKKFMASQEAAEKTAQR
jgi:TRAP-type C4-dicarboxylate transport system permease small subunit